jgi:rhomboid family protein
VKVVRIGHRELAAKCPERGKFATSPICRRIEGLATRLLSLRIGKSMLGKMRSTNFSSAAWPPDATRVLIALSAGMFLWQWSVLMLTPMVRNGASVFPLDAFRAALFDLARPGPIDDIGALSLAGLKAGHWWQPVTHLFLHGGLLQLGFSLILLAAAGNPLERILGRRHLVGIFLCGGLAGAVIRLAVEKDLHLLGSFAATCAVAVAATTILPEQDLRMFRLFRRLPGPLPAKYFAASLTFVLVLLFLVDNGPAVSARQLQSAHLAPLAGCFVGWLYARALGFGRRVPVYLRSRPVPALIATSANSASPDSQLASTDPHEFIREAIDPILEKISREGLDHLTPGERRLLEQASERLPDSSASKK